MKNFDQKKLLIVAGVIVVVLLLGGVFLANRKSSNSNQSTSSIKNEAVIPTVDSSVQVSLTAQKGNKEVKLSVTGIPNGTQSLEYELSYETSNRGTQGIITQPIDINGQSSWDKVLTLGTCSSGTCVYDLVTSPISISLKFTGSYGQRVFEKQFPLQ